MIRNYFKTVLRNFRRHKLFTFINVIGLSIGISAALVIYLIVHFDLTFDKFEKDSDRIYRISSSFVFQGDKGYNPGVTTALTQSIDQVPGVEYSVPIWSLGPDVYIPQKDGAPTKFKSEQWVTLAGSNYFKMIDYQWLAGSVNTALAEPNKVVLTSKQADKYFPGLTYQQMMGKTITYDTLKVTVTGIVASLKQNSDFGFTDIISYSTGLSKANKALNSDMQLDQWGSTNSSSQLFIKVAKNGSAATIDKQVNQLLAKNRKSDLSGSKSFFNLIPLGDLHFNQDYGLFNGTDRVANKKTLYYLLGIAGFLLLLGCINFINLTTAQASQRAKEIGIRKTMGSSRAQLISQFLSETFIITIIAVIISLALAPLILKLFSDFIPKDLHFQVDVTMILFLIGLIIIVSFASGFYPALLLSGYKPVSVLKNQVSNAAGQTRNAWLRKSLTVTQFVIALFFIMGTIMVSKQVYYALHKDMGFKKDAIVIVNTPYKNRTSDNLAVFRHQLEAIPQVQMVSQGASSPANNGFYSSYFTYKTGGKEIKTDVQMKYGDDNYMKLYQLRIAAGRAIKLTDTSKALVINEAYLKVLGFTNPTKALGKYVEFNKKQMEIVGVVHDFYAHSIRVAVAPMVILAGGKPNQLGTFHIALKPETPGGHEWKAATTAMEQLFKKDYPEEDFSFNFFDDSIKKFYDAEQHIATLLTWATALSIIISCLGLSGLALYTTNLRTKEIGVRKVLGASVAQIIALLSKEMVWLIALALVIVTPIAYWSMHKWMEGYVDKTPISWWIFALSGVGMLLAALITSSFQTMRAATVNPVKSLRSE